MREFSFERKAFKFIVFLFALIFVVHLGAMIFYWYWSIWWFDVLTHFLGGLWMGLTLGLAYLILKPKGDFLLFFLAVFVGSAVLGGLWEVYEYYAKIGGGVEGYYLDTKIDMLVDLIGSSVGSVVLYFAHRFSKK